jgi:hypothetical protein
MGERFLYYDIWVKIFKYYIIDLYNTDNRADPAHYKHIKITIRNLAATNYVLVQSLVYYKEVSLPLQIE